MKAIVLTLVIGLVLYLLAVRIYNDWLFLRRSRLNALGRTIEFTNSWAPWLHELSAGSLVAVEYPSGFPQKARIPGSYSFLLAYGLSFVILAMLVVFVVTPDR
jgi:hypothetical protein